MHFQVQIFDNTACENEEAFTVEPRQEPTMSLGKKDCSTNEKLAEPSRRGRGRPRKEATLFPKIRRRLSCKCLPSEKEKKRVANLALSFASRLHHPYFLRSMSYSAVYVSFVCVFPTAFARSNLSKDCAKVVLKNQEGKTWKVNFMNRTTSCFCGGWLGFVYDNKLEAGDVYMFELVAKLQFCVHIFCCQTS